jgi:hypothetical protein
LPEFDGVIVCRFPFDRYRYLPPENRVQFCHGLQNLPSRQETSIQGQESQNHASTDIQTCPFAIACLGYLVTSGFFFRWRRDADAAWRWQQPSNDGITLAGRRIKSLS